MCLFILYLIMPSNLLLFKCWVLGIVCLLINLLHLFIYMKLTCHHLKSQTKQSSLLTMPPEKLHIDILKITICPTSGIED